MFRCLTRRFSDRSDINEHATNRANKREPHLGIQIEGKEIKETQAKESDERKTNVTKIAMHQKKISEL